MQAFKSLKAKDLNFGLKNQGLKAKDKHHCKKPNFVYDDENVKKCA